MDNASVISAIRNKGYAADPDLADAEITEAISHIQREIQWKYPLVTTGIFNSVPFQQVYDIFNPVSNPATSQGVFPGGIWVLDLVFSPAGAGQSLDVFGIAPFLQGLSIAPGEITTYSFQTPTDFHMWDLNWNSFVKRFGMLDFRHVNNQPGSPIEIYPLPRDTNPIFVRYQKYRTVAQMSTENDSWYLELIEGQCCRTIANKLAMSAGITQGKVKDDGTRARYWQAKADRHYEDGWQKLRDMGYEVISPAQRS
jgi:hypothetical protein